MLDLVAKCHGVSVSEAVTILTGNGLSPARPLFVADSSHCAASKGGGKKFNRRKAEASLRRAQAEFAGSPGSEYTTLRGLNEETAKVFGIGYNPARPWKDHETGKSHDRPAILLPWYDELGELSGIQYRFLDDRGHDARFGREVGSRCLVFGRQQLQGPERAENLILVEGEINALSLWQVFAPFGYDVLSVGSQSNHKGVSEMIPLAKRYQRIAVWFDEASTALKARGLLPAAVPVKSPMGLDANDILLQHGHGVLREALFGYFDEARIPHPSGTFRIHKACLWEQDGYEPFPDPGDLPSTPEALLARLSNLGAIVTLDPAGRLRVKGDLPTHMREDVRERRIELEQVLERQR